MACLLIDTEAINNTLGTINNILEMINNILEMINNILEMINQSELMIVDVSFITAEMVGHSNDCDRLRLQKIAI